MAMSKEQQQAEAAARETERRTSEIEAAPEVEAETTSPPESVTPKSETKTEPSVEEPSPRPMRLLKDTKRDEIVARFRTQRQEESADESDDVQQIRRFTREGIPPELVEEDTPAPVEEPSAEEPVTEAAPEEPPPVAEEPKTSPPPTKRKVVIRGKEMELTDEELVAAAQKSLAADDYLDEAKRKLREVDDLYRQSKTQGERTAQPAHSGKNGAQPEPGTQAEGAEQPSDPYTQLGEAVQFGEPADVGKRLSDTIEASSRKETEKALLQYRLNSEAIQTRRILSDFQRDNAELATDDNASAVIRERLIRMQYDDLKALLGDEAKLPKTSDEVMNWHQQYRSEGYNVRDVPTLLKTAKDDYLSWRNPEPVKKTETEAPKEVPKPETVKPQVVISKAREIRRETVPQHPSRTVAPKPDTTRAPVERDRSTIVQDMKLARQAPKVLRG